MTAAHCCKPMRSDWEGGQSQIMIQEHISKFLTDEIFISRILYFANVCRNDFRKNLLLKNGNSVSRGFDKKKLSNFEI